MSGLPSKGGGNTYLIFMLVVKVKGSRYYIAHGVIAYEEPIIDKKTQKQISLSSSKAAISSIRQSLSYLAPGIGFQKQSGKE